MKQRLITIFGGSGFVGKYVAAELAKQGFLIQIASRAPEKAMEAKIAGAVGQITLSKCDIKNIKSVEKVIKNSYGIVNLVGILFESGKQNFDLHSKYAENIAKAANKAGVQKFIHFSALSVDKNKKANYAKSKLAGENLVLNAFPKAIIIRPSLICGAEDKFINYFAHMSVISPCLPLMRMGKTKFQPVFVVDVARAVTSIMLSSTNKYRIYELCGPKTYSFKELVELILFTIRKKRILLPLPDSISWMMGLFMGMLPNKPFTIDQYKMLGSDNIASQAMEVGKLEDLSVSPTPIEAVIPTYLARYYSNNTIL